MNPYLRRVWRNLRPLCLEQQDVEEALAEWLYSGDYKRGAGEQCQLCDHEDLRDQYEIVNRHTGYRLWVGSKCIEKFQVPTLDKESGEVVVGKAAANVLARDKRETIRTRVRKQMLSAFDDWLRRESDFGGMAKSFRRTYERKGCFSPKQLNAIIWRFSELKIAHPIVGIKMTLRSSRDKDQLAKLLEWQFERLALYLSADQRKRALAIRAEQGPI